MDELPALSRPDVGCMGYPEPLIDMLSALTVEHESATDNLDGIDDQALLHIAAAVINLIESIADASRVTPATYGTVSSVVHAALQRGVLRADPRVGIHDDDDHGDAA